MSAAKIKYLLTIFNMSASDGRVKPVDIAAAMEYSRASVCKMIDIFVVEGLLTKNIDRTVALTAKGESEAKRYYTAYIKVKNLLLDIFSCNENLASKDAVSILSCLSKANFQKLL